MRIIKHKRALNIVDIREKRGEVTGVERLPKLKLILLVFDRV